MIKGSFEIWEFAVMIMAALILISGFALNSMENGSPEIAVFAGFLTMAAILFVRPVWLLVNRKRIESWEHTKATVKNKSFEKVHSRYTNYVIKLTLAFKDKMNKHYLETFNAPAFMRHAKEGDEYEIAFDPKQPDRLIALNPAHKQAVLMTVFGIILEIAMTILWIIAFVLDKGELQ